jgi:hypothetical protein
MYSSRQLARDVGKFDTVADTTDSAYVQAADFTHFGELAQVLRARLGGGDREADLRSSPGGGNLP